MSRQETECRTQIPTPEAPMQFVKFILILTEILRLTCGVAEVKTNAGIQIWNINPNRVSQFTAGQTQRQPGKPLTNNDKHHEDWTQLRTNTGAHHIHTQAGRVQVKNIKNQTDKNKARLKHQTPTIQNKTASKASDRTQGWNNRENGTKTQRQGVNKQLLNREQSKTKTLTHVSKH